MKRPERLHFCRLAVAAVLWLAAASALAEDKGPAFFSSESRGRVVSAAEGKPVEGAIVVMRWEWDEYYPAVWAPGHGRSAGYHHSVFNLHIAEVATDREGSFSVPGWGPVLRPGGRMSLASPRIFVFKPGFLPAELAKPYSGRAPETIALATANADIAYAEAIADFQASSGYGGLQWTRENSDWKRMPRLVAALQAEKERLGPTGRTLLGMHLLYGMSGKGQLVLPGAEQVSASRMGSGVPGGMVVAVAWTVRGPGNVARRFVQQFGVQAGRSEVAFAISPWRLPSVAPPGWRLDHEATPIVRVYATGYRMLEDMPWGSSGHKLGMERLPPGIEAELAELRRWRKDIEAELQGADNVDAVESQRLLAWTLERECSRLTMDVRSGVCLEPGTPMAVAARNRPADHPSTLPDDGRPRFVREMQSGAGSAIGAQEVARPKALGPPKPVDGFTIQPVPPAARNRP